MRNDMCACATHFSLSYVNYSRWPCLAISVRNGLASVRPSITSVLLSRLIFWP